MLMLKYMDNFMARNLSTILAILPYVNIFIFFLCINILNNDIFVYCDEDPSKELVVEDKGLNSKGEKTKPVLTYKHLAYGLLGVIVGIIFCRDFIDVFK